MLSRQLEIGVSLELRNKLRIGEVNLGIISVEVKGEAVGGDEITQNENTAREEMQINDRTLETASLKGARGRERLCVCVSACVCKNNPIKET